MISTEGDIVIGLIGALLFLFRNPDKNYKTQIFIFVVGLFASQAVFIYSDKTLPGQIIWVISAVGLLIYYSLRLRKKQNKQIIDFVKPFGLLLLVIYPIPFYSLIPVGESDFWTVINNMTFFALGTIYIYDRLIIKPQKMKKTFIITLTIQTVLLGLFIIYAFVQKIESDRQREIADEQHMKSEQLYYDLNKEIDKLKEELKNCR